MKKSKEIQTMSLQVTDEASVTVIPHEDHEYIMTTKEVAKGYGVSVETIRRHKQEHADEFVEGKHFLANVQILNAGKPPVKRTEWTKRGIVRLGFFVKSELAKTFRDLAEDLIIQKMGQSIEPYTQPTDYSRLLELVDKASIILGTQSRLANRLGFSPSVFSHLRTMPWLTSDFRKKQIELVCKKIIFEGANYVPNIRDMEGGEIDKVGILSDICRIEDNDVRLSLLDKLNEGGVL